MKKLPKWATTVTPLSKTLALIIFITFPILGFCFGRKYQSALDQIEISPSVGMANPASVFCEKQEGKTVIISEKDGSQRGGCVFKDGRQCDEWQFFRTKTSRHQV
jgi:hypothetical protein